MSEEKQESKIFHLKGKMEYELEIEEHQFRYRGQVSNENNLAHLIAIRELTADFIKRQKNPALEKKQKISKKELEMVIATNRWTSMTSERLASSIYTKAVEKNLTPDLPKIDIVQPMANLKIV